jgi:pimeloyl-ACP methyl ester carboxylesterase
MNAYEDVDVRGFDVQKYDGRWKKLGTKAASTGLSVDYYVRKENGLSVLVAVRGTRGPNALDWYANLSWFTAIIPVPSSYDSARASFLEVRREVEAIANGDTISYVVTGHSLGGGVAQHLAFAFPCVAAVVFDTSPVVNRYRLREPYAPKIVLLHERGDELTWLKRLLMSDAETASYRHYPVDTIPRGHFKHAITPMAVGMARMAVECQFDKRRGKRPGCRVPASDKRPKELYCGSWGKIGPDEICRD